MVTAPTYPGVYGEEIPSGVRAIVPNLAEPSRLAFTKPNG
jgi:hypothetical protein